MTRHTPSVTWRFFKRDKPRKLGRLLQGCVQTSTSSDLRVTLVYDGSDPDMPGVWTFTMHRDDMRMMARRILQCLEATK